jgi:zinc protease
MKKAFAPLLLFVSLQALAVTLPPLKIETYSLPNGLMVCLYEDHSTPIVGVNINYFVGSKNEKPGRTGFAHLFEHMMFQGSKNFNDDYFKALEPVGAFVNGATSQDRTRYLEIVPSNYLERALWLESDRMGFLLDAMTEDRLKNQISVVSNEKRQNYDDAPYGKAYGEALKVLYPPEHPYSWTTIGAIPDLEAASLEDVKDFFRTYYTPNNAVLTIAGDFQPAEAKALVEKYFGSIPPGPPVARIDSWTPRLDGVKRIIMQDRVQLARMTMMWPTVPYFFPGDAELDLFAKAFGQGKSSRLYQKLVKGGLATDVAAYQHSGQIAGSFQVVVTALPGKSLREIEAIVKGELAAALKEGITPAELEQGQNTIAAGFVRGLENIGGFGGISDQIGSYVHHLGKPDMFQWDLDRYQKATLDGVMAAAREHLNPATHYGVVEVHPFETFQAADETADRSKMPGPGGALKLEIPTPAEFPLANGLRIITLPYNELPVTALHLVLPAGARNDPADRPGLASLTGSMLMEGTATRSAEAIADRLDFLGSTLSVQVGTDGAFVRASSLTDKLPETLELMFDIVLHPAFPEKELNILKKRRASEFLRRQDSLQQIAGMTLTKNFFAGHPYGHLDIGAPEAVAKMTAADLAGFHRQFFQPQAATLIVVGGKSADELKKLLEPYAKAWPKGDLAVKPVAPTAAPKAPTVYFVDKPGAAQSVVSVAVHGLDRTSPDYAAATVLNHLYGGYFGSRLNMNLREEKGYTYGARSRFGAMAARGYWSAGAPVQASATADSLKEIFNEIGGITGTEPFGAEEFETVKANLVQSLPQDLETPVDLAFQMEDVALYQLPLDTINREYAALQTVTIADIQRTAEKYFKGATAAVVVVGDQAKVLESVQALGLGAIVFCDKLGNPLPAK